MRALRFFILPPIAEAAREKALLAAEACGMREMTSELQAAATFGFTCEVALPTNDHTHTYRHTQAALLESLFPSRADNQSPSEVTFVVPDGIIELGTIDFIAPLSGRSCSAAILRGGRVCGTENEGTTRATQET